MCDMEGSVVGHHDPKHASDRAQCEVFTVSFRLPNIQN
jgi:hypothetical protein